MKRYEQGCYKLAKLNLQQSWCESHDEIVVKMFGYQHQLQKQKHMSY